MAVPSSTLGIGELDERPSEQSSQVISTRVTTEQQEAGKDANGNWISNSQNKVIYLIGRGAYGRMWVKRIVIQSTAAQDAKLREEIRKELMQEAEQKALEKQQEEKGIPSLKTAGIEAPPTLDIASLTAGTDAETEQAKKLRHEKEAQALYKELLTQEVKQEMEKERVDKIKEELRKELLAELANDEKTYGKEGTGLGPPDIPDVMGEVKYSMMTEAQKSEYSERQRLKQEVMHEIQAQMVEEYLPTARAERRKELAEQEAEAKAAWDKKQQGIFAAPDSGINIKAMMANIMAEAQASQGLPSSQKAEDYKNFKQGIADQAKYTVYKEEQAQMEEEFTAYYGQAQNNRANLIAEERAKDQATEAAIKNPKMELPVAGSDMEGFNFNKKSAPFLTKNEQLKEYATDLVRQEVREQLAEERRGEYAAKYEQEAAAEMKKYFAILTGKEQAPNAMYKPEFAEPEVDLGILKPQLTQEQKAYLLQREEEKNNVRKYVQQQTMEVEEQEYKELVLRMAREQFAKQTAPGYVAPQDTLFSAGQPSIGMSSSQQAWQARQSKLKSDIQAEVDVLVQEQNSSQQNSSQTQSLY